MKLKYALCVLMSLFMASNSSAQIFKKITKRAEKAAERTILKKTDQTVSKTTEKAFDSVANRPKSKKEQRKEYKESKTTSNSSNEDSVDLELDISVDSYKVQLNQQTTFTIILTNKGNVDATNVVITAKAPSGYTFVNNVSTQGSYTSGNGVWTVGNLSSGGAAKLTVTVLVINEVGLMYHAEVTSCSEKDSDSSPNNGVDTDNDTIVIDDSGDEDDGDAQNVIIEKINSGSTSGTTTDSGPDTGSTTTTTVPDGPNYSLDDLEDIKLVLKDKKGQIQYYYFDFEPLAMRVEFDKKKEPPMYFDIDGYVYVSEKKNKYMKVPFSQMKSMVGNMSSMFTAFGGDMPNAPAADEPIEYYGMHLGPYLFPILEWAFVYKPEYFVGAEDINEESQTCRGASGCRKFTLTSGKDRGSYVLFDTKGRLAEIFSIKSGNAAYTYEECKVVLPAAQAMNLPFGN